MGLPRGVAFHPSQGAEGVRLEPGDQRGARHGTFLPGGQRGGDGEVRGVESVEEAAESIGGERRIGRGERGCEPGCRGVELAAALQAVREGLFGYGHGGAGLVFV